MARALFVALLYLVIRPALASGPPTPAELRLATWNMEWLLTPETSLSLRVLCAYFSIPNDDAHRAMPDVLRTLFHSVLRRVNPNEVIP